MTLQLTVQQVAGDHPGQIDPDACWMWAILMDGWVYDNGWEYTQASAWRRGRRELKSLEITLAEEDDHGS